jgi:hypothetical protein
VYLHFGMFVWDKKKDAKAAAAHIKTALTCDGDCAGAKLVLAQVCASYMSVTCLLHVCYMSVTCLLHVSHTVVALQTALGRNWSWRRCRCLNYVHILIQETPRAHMASSDSSSM